MRVAATSLELPRRAGLAPRRAVAEQLEMRCATGRLHRDDRDGDVGKAVEALLRGPLVGSSLTGFKAERLVDGRTYIGIRHADSRVVDAQPDLTVQPAPVPPGARSLAGRKLQQFERMAVRVTEFEGLYAAGGGGQKLWAPLQRSA